MYQDMFCLAYGALCAAVVWWLARILHRYGTVFLHDAFREKSEVVRALGRLLDVGLYLIGAGYVAVTFPSHFPLHNPAQVALATVGKLGGFLLLLGFLHFFNLLILALVRQRPVRVARAGELS